LEKDELGRIRFIGEFLRISLYGLFKVFSFQAVRIALNEEANFQSFKTRSRKGQMTMDAFLAHLNQRAPKGGHSPGINGDLQ
jgi:hypothetical protein